MRPSRWRSLFALTGLVLSASSFVAQPQTKPEDVTSTKLRIEWSEFKRLYDAKRIEVVDIRSKESYRLGHIPGARSVPLENVEKHAPELAKAKKPIVTYCACPAEDTSARAALILQEQGLDARALVGGYHKWLEVVGRAEK